MNFRGLGAMFKQYRTFFCILLMILLMIVIVMVMYAYTVNTSTNTIRKDIQSNNLNRIRFFVNSLDHNVHQLNMMAIALETDAKIALLPSIHLMDSYEQVRLIQDISEKMNLQSFSKGWTNQVSIYAPLIQKWIGSTPTQKAPPSNWNGSKWEFDSSLQAFVTYRIKNGYTIQVTFPQSNITEMLDGATLHNNDPFFFKPDSKIIMNRKSNASRIHELLSVLMPSLTGNEGTEIVSVGGTLYMVNYLRSDTLGWYMVDYLPLNETLQPIVRIKNLFYATCIVFFLATVTVVLYLYRKVQVPIVTLLKGVRLLKHGDFSFRIKRVSRNEFDILYENFNDMADQIENLMENVYKEKIISREATIKQLQAQINPHFLYNCLFFINNMTRLGNDEAVIAMTQNLAEYFRYTTRLDEPITTLEKEMEIVEKYLKIQSLRMDRLRYEIHIPDSMKQLPVPKLLIQPLVENSVIHGIEEKQSAGLIRIRGAEDEHTYRIVVEDDGKGMSEQEIQALMYRIKQPLDDTSGSALWNIQQRMNIHFKKPAGMEFSRSSIGGLRVTLYWSKS